jgi:hypothetical protein
VRPSHFRTLDHTLINAILVAVLLWTQTIEPGPLPQFCFEPPPALALLQSSDIPSGILASHWFRCPQRSSQETQAYVSLLLPTSLSLWFLIGLYLDRAPRPHFLGRNFLILRAVFLLTIPFGLATYLFGFLSMACWAAFAALTIRALIPGAWRSARQRIPNRT